MKKNILVIVIITFSISLTSQNKNNRFGIFIGAGSQKYKGDLGNGFTLKNNCWYGTYSAQFSYYLNKYFDGGVFLTAGNYGFSQPDDIKMKEVLSDDRCPGCFGRKGIGNVSARLYSAGAMAKFKFANGFLLNENFPVRPYIYAGASVVELVDVMKMKCVQPGRYYSFNVGFGFKYYLTDNINIGYNMALGRFTSDHLDYKIKNGDNDMYLQQTLNVGIDLF
ncbi:MAG: outer membrane beta-barrel protein [Bacteroidetes bacterium]|nr:outer membrane beta-barrel protein [Bacteroidota bacterium]